MTAFDRRGSRRLLFLRVSGRSIAAEIEEELAFHIAERTDALVAGGMPREAARRVAVAEFGDVAASRRELAAVDRRRYRSTTVKTWISEVTQDLHGAWRALRSHPMLALVVAINLSVGVAATTTVFAAVDAYLVQPLPFRQPDRLIAVWTRIPARSDPIETSPADFVDWRAAARTVDLAAYASAEFNLAAGPEPQRVVAARVTPRLFTLLGVLPALGRALGDDDERRDAAHVAILSDALWRERFKADSAVIGTRILLDGDAYAVVGVMPPAFAFPNHFVQIWTPLVIDPASASREARTLSIVGRLSDGLALTAVRLELARLAARSSRSSAAGIEISTTVEPLSYAFYDETLRRAMTIVMLAALLLLLIACANIANLLLARGAARVREMAVRAALGASRARLIRQMLTEALALAMAGGLAGLLLAHWGVAAFAAIAPPNVERTETVRLSAHTFMFALIATIASGLLFGVLPALRVARGGLEALLRDDDRSSTGGGRNGLAAGLAFAELTLAVALLVPAGLLMQAGARLHQMRFGFEAHDITTLDVSMPPVQFADVDHLLVAQAALLGRLRAMASAEGAGMVNRFPMTVGQRVAYRVSTDAPARRGHEPTAQYRIASGDYFGAMRIPVLGGRTFAAADRIGSPLVIMVSEAFVRRHWPSRRSVDAAVGRRLAFTTDSAGVTREIVGVVGDTREFGPYQPPSAMIYVPSTQAPSRRMTYVVRAHGAPIDAATLRAAVRSVDPRLPAYNIQRADDLIRTYELPALAMPRVLVVFGFAALVLTVAGVYGLFSNSVARRTRELGVRLTLGAQQSDIMRLVMSRAALLIVTGLAAGFAIAVLFARALSFFLFGLSAYDPVVYGIVAAVVVIAGIAASYLPARRATRIDPMATLRLD